MGFFDDLKKSFENDERLSSQAKAPSVNAGKSSKVPDYVKAKVDARKKYDAENALVVSHLHNFKKGVVFLYERMNMYRGGSKP